MYFFEVASILQSHMQHVEQNNLNVSDIAILLAQLVSIIHIKKHGPLKIVCAH